MSEWCSSWESRISSPFRLDTDVDRADPVHVTPTLAPRVAPASGTAS
jgi:hypothetical protein